MKKKRIFILMTRVGVLDGMVRCDLRRYGAGYESSSFIITPNGFKTCRMYFLPHY
ncbi:DUF4400 domain-containing protein [Rosenbergiella australiborealis]|uniref:DUF4400 domain-containing protein n=1 Tax=Rosenbergiella australiborealis TaxID=1544696 RepID=UPI001F4DE04B|nr:DUF4400 domain-containing protein [Rosenbergiella australiborealis]